MLGGRGDNVPRLIHGVNSLAQPILKLDVMVPEMPDAIIGPVSGPIVEYELVVTHKTSMSVLDS